MRHSPLQRARVGLHAGRSLLADRLRSRVRRVGSLEPGTLGDLFDAHPARTVFVHVGLSDVAAALPGNPYHRVRDALTARYENVLVPGFTPAFLETGVYHRQHSRPEFGTFARLFLEDATYRTADPVYSILVDGDYRFDDCRHTESFSRESCFGKLDRDDVLFVNVGTDGFRCSHLHYVERQADVPYCTVSDHEGVVYHTDTEREAVSHTCLTDDFYRRFNRAKLESVLSDAGVLATYDRRGLRVRFCRARDVRTVLEPRLAADSYFCIT